jgi:surface polysaccharide O-acyltransferase-like enzyme
MFGIALRAAGALSTWCWLIFLIGLGGKAFNFGGNFLTYFRESGLPIYILHQTVILLIGFHILKTGIGLRVSFIVIVAGSFLITILLYEAIRRNNMLRLFFGMRWK